MGFNSRELKQILLDFFLTDVQYSRGKFDEIRWWFMINPAPIAWQSSLNVWGSQRTQYLSFKSHSSFMIQSRVKKKRGSTSVFKGEFPPDFSAIWSGRESDLMATIARWSWPIIWRDRVLNRKVIWPRSCGDRATIKPQSWATNHRRRPIFIAR